MKRRTFLNLAGFGTVAGTFALNSSTSNAAPAVKITSYDRPKRIPEGVSKTSYNSTYEDDIARGLREKLLAAPHRPGYHFVISEGLGLPFDPNGAIFWKGRYHLFYIFQDSRTGKGDHNWGHVSSTDLFHWRHHPTTLIGGMFSGNCFVNKDGVPTICHHQNQKARKGNAMLVALDDDLNNWKDLESNPITPVTKEGDEHHGKYKSWDPFGFVDNDMYYAIFGGTKPAIAKCKTLDGDWEYVGDLLSHRDTEGIRKNEDVSCADMFKLGGKDVLLCISHRIGCRYYIGQWKNEQFHPEYHQQMSWADRSFFAPRSMEDNKGRRIMWAWVLDGPKTTTRRDLSWSGTMSLPRVLTMNDKKDKLHIDVADEIKNLRYNPRGKQNITVKADTSVKLDDISGNSIELDIEMNSKDAKQFGVKVCVSPDGEEETLVYYDAENKKITIDTNKSDLAGKYKSIEAGPLYLADNETLNLRIFVDKSIVEVFANGQALVRRIYPSRKDSLAVRLFSKGGTTKVSKVDAWDIMPSNPY